MMKLKLTKQAGKSVVKVKKSESDEDFGKSKRLRLNTVPKKRIALVIAVLALLSLAVVAYTNRKPGDAIPPKGGIAVGQSAYTKQKIDTLVSEAVAATQLSEADAKKLVIDYLTEREAVVRQGINPDQGSLESIKTWHDLFDYHQRVINSYKSLQAGRYEGYLFAYDFGRKITPQYPDDVPQPNHGDPKAIAKDRVYAQKQANIDRNEYKAHKISADKLLSKLKADAQLSYQYGSFHFDSESNGSDLAQQIVYESALQFIRTQTKPGISTVQTGALLLDGWKESKETYFYFVDIMQAHQPITDPAGYIKQAADKLRVNYDK